MDLQELIEFKNWADEVYLNYLDEISDDKFDTTVEVVKKSLRSVITHLYISYWGDYHLLTDRDWSGEPDFKNLTKDQLIDGIKTYNSKILELVQTNSLTTEITYFEPDLDKEITTTPEKLIFNFVTHSAYHRGQMALLLRHHGYDSIEMTDFNPYIYKLKGYRD